MSELSNTASLIAVVKNNERGALSGPPLHQKAKGVEVIVSDK